MCKGVSIIIHCNVVRDFIPQYVKGTLSEESKDFINNHLRECPECKKLFNSKILNKTQNCTDSLSEIIKKERKKIIIRFSIAIVSVIIVLFAVFAYSFGVEGNTWFTEITLESNEVYENHPEMDEIEAASKAIIEHFRNNYGGCVLLTVDYKADDDYDPLNKQIGFYVRYYNPNGHKYGSGFKYNSYYWDVEYNKKNDEWQYGGSVP